MPHEKPDANDHKRSLAGGRSMPSGGDDDGRPAIDGVVDGDESVARYLYHLAQLDMPLAMKIELVRALRAIMQNFVDRAFGDDPVQLTLSSNEQGDKGDENISHVMLSSNNNVNDRKIEGRLGISGAWKGKQ